MEALPLPAENLSWLRRSVCCATVRKLPTSDGGYRAIAASPALSLARISLVLLEPGEEAGPALQADARMLPGHDLPSPAQPSASVQPSLQLYASSARVRRNVLAFHSIDHA